jgi:dGTPase
MAEAEGALKAFLYEHMYRSGPVQAIAAEAKKVIAGLFEAYRADPSRLPAEWQHSWPDETAMLRTIGDFVAGMTDRYAIAQYRHHVGPVSLPEIF